MKLNFFGENHPCIPDILINIGILSSIIGKYDRAEKYYDKTL